jgi:uncharacterized SAM-binding protein YcdF (DUF218 family)
MGSLLSFVFSIDGAVAALIVTGICVATRPKSTAARTFLLAVSCLYAVAGIYAVPAVVARLLLTRGYHEFAAADAGAGPTAIVVLGGGCDTIDGWNGGQKGVLGDESAARVLEAARVVRLMPDALVISSGGAAINDGKQLPVAIVMRDHLVQLGIPASKILLETESRDTHDEAVAIGPMLRARAIRQAVLVTSDVHMRRAVGAFREQGWEVVPAIAPDPSFDRPWRHRVVPNGIGLAFSNAVVHELAGIPYYWARGWWR